MRNRQGPQPAGPLSKQIALLCLLDLYIYTTNEYPNVKQLSWAINYPGPYLPLIKKVLQFWRIFVLHNLPLAVLVPAD